MPASPAGDRPSADLRATLARLLLRRRTLASLKTERPVTSEQLLEYALQASEVLRVEFAEKQCLAMQAVDKCLLLIREERRNQMTDLEKCCDIRKSLSAAAIQTSDKLEAAQRRQDDLSARVEAVLRRLKGLQPGLSKAEQEMRSQLESVQRDCGLYANSLREIRERQEFQQKVMTSAEGEVTSRTLAPEDVRRLEKALDVQ